MSYPQNNQQVDKCDIWNMVVKLKPRDQNTYQKDCYYG